LIGGSGFIACFCGGLLFAVLDSEKRRESLDASEYAGNTLSLLTWVLFGSALLVQYLTAVNWTAVLYALLSLTVLRMLPVALALAGSGIPPAEKLFLGWFGPRGLASIVFLVMYLDAELPGTSIVVETVVWTITLSVILHGISANPRATLLATFEQKADKGST